MSTAGKVAVEPGEVEDRARDLRAAWLTSDRESSMPKNCGAMFAAQISGQKKLVKELAGGDGR